MIPTHNKLGSSFDNDSIIVAKNKEFEKDKNEVSIGSQDLGNFEESFDINMPGEEEKT